MLPGRARLGMVSLGELRTLFFLWKGYEEVLILGLVQVIEK